MAGSRPISTGTLAAAGAGSSSPIWFLEVDWSASFASYLSSYGAATWGGQTWVGAGLVVDDFGPDGKPSRVTLTDTDAAFRTLQLTNGLRDKRIRLWKGYAAALGSGDPVRMFDGYADGAEWSNGKLSFALDWASSDLTLTPRERIGPNIGVNFTATPGTKIWWNGQTLTMEGR